MKIDNHRLILDDGTPAPFRQTPNVSAGRKLDPRFLVMHYTAGRNFQSSVSWLTDAAAKASAHLVIGRGGEIAQLAPFDAVTWHAGVSQWRGLSGLNAYSIGIELDNAGPLTRTAAGGFSAWFGGAYKPEDAIEATHKNESAPRFWHRYPDDQIDIAARVAALLTAEYGLEDVIGHDDISPGRKADPGPAFPLAAVRARAIGRAQEDKVKAETTANLNIRTGPGAGFERLPESPLKPGVKLHILSEQGSWCSVEVLDAQGRPTATGWVHGDYVRVV